MNNFEKLYKDLRDGETICNDDLLYLFKRSRNMVEALVCTGDVFYCARKEAHRIYLDVRQILKARGIQP